MGKKPEKKIVKKYGKKYTTFYWKPEKGKFINKESIKKTFAELKKRVPNVYIDVKAELGGMWKTISKQGKLNLKEEEEYYEGKVKDVDKLTEIEGIVMRYYED
jgi:hypothetical protein